MRDLTIRILSFSHVRDKTYHIVMVHDADTGMCLHLNRWGKKPFVGTVRVVSRFENVHRVRGKIKEISARRITRGYTLDYDGSEKCYGAEHDIDRALHTFTLSPPLRGRFKKEIASWVATVGAASEVTTLDGGSDVQVGVERDCESKSAKNIVKNQLWGSW